MRIFFSALALSHEINSTILGSLFYLRFDLSFPNIHLEMSLTSGSLSLVRNTASQLTNPPWSAACTPRVWLALPKPPSNLIASLVDLLRKAPCTV